MKKTPKRARSDEQKERRRETIVDAAEKVIARVGLNNAHFGEVAKQAKLSRPLIYVYFPKQEDLFHAVCERALFALEEAFGEVEEKGRTGLDRVVDLAHAYHDFAVSRPLYFTVISELQTYGIDPAHANEIEASVFELSKRVVGVVAEAVAQGKKDGSIRADIGDPVLAAMSVWSVTHGIIQISSTKQKMLKAEFSLDGSDVVDHGFELLRAAFASETAKKKKKGRG
ncbi:TetR/AcrR family transcriptional regulator [Nibricoccus sp. IMCC34717]|uniref:TetR/AcrR family transcriptional regulator n=1 Tax=Nibricoccus sp. IMCC34717 TaxID=3034021 RepID=UPI0038507320